MASNSITFILAAADWSAGVAPLRRVTRSVAREVGIVPDPLFVAGRGTDERFVNRRRRGTGSAKVSQAKRTAAPRHEIEDDENDSSTEDMYDTGSSERDDSSGGSTGAGVAVALPLYSVVVPAWPRYAMISLTIESVIGVPCLAGVIIRKPLIALDTLLVASVLWLAEFVYSNVDVYSQATFHLVKSTNWQLDYGGSLYSCHPGNGATFRDLGISHCDVVVTMSAITTAENATTEPGLVGCLSLDDPTDDLPLIYSAYPTVRRVYFSRFRRGIRRLGDSGCYPMAVDLRGPNVTAKFMRRGELVHDGGCGGVGGLANKSKQLQAAVRYVKRSENAPPICLGLMDESGMPLLASATVGSENLRENSVLTLFMDIRPPSDVLASGPRQLLYVALTKGKQAHDDNVYCIPVWCSPYVHTLADVKDAWLYALYIYAGAARAEAIRSNFKCVSFALPGDRTCRRLADTGDFSRRLDYWKIPHGATVEIAIKMMPLARLKNHSF